MNNTIDALIKEENPSLKRQLSFVIRLSIPAMLAQLSSIIMQYIDAAMVGQLGQADAAAIGLVSTTTWLFGGIVSATSIGFTVQVAQRVGAGEYEKARNIMKQGLIVGLVISTLMAFIGAIISKPLPIWLGGGNELHEKSTAYFLIYILATPFFQMNSMGTGFLQASGNMKIPSALNILVCILDVVFNMYFIFPSRNISIGGVHIFIPGCNLGIKGAALGTALSVVVVVCIMMSYLLFFSQLKFHKYEKTIFSIQTMKKALRISIPAAAEQVFMCGAMVVTTTIIAPLGAIAIAANSFAITAESLCYMPGYGIGSASTALIGQSFGSGKKKLTRRLSYVTVGFGMAVMTVTGILMYIFAPFMMQILTPDIQIQELGVRILRIEAFAEPFYAASIVATGVFRGVGNTLIPSAISFVSMWLVRIPVAAVLTGFMGLEGAWVAMCAELCVRGIIFLIYLVKKI